MRDQRRGIAVQQRWISSEWSSAGFNAPRLTDTAQFCSSLCLRTASIPLLFLCVITVRFVMSVAVEMSDCASGSRVHGQGETSPAGTEVSHVQFHVDAEQEQASSSLLSGGAGADSAGGDDDGDEIVCRVKKYKWVPPAGSEQRVYKPHQGEGSQYLRDFILGVNDGIISTFLVVVGIVAGGGTVTTALLGGISSAVAGAIRSVK